MFAIDTHTLHLATRMAVTLSGLPSISPSHCMGEPTTLPQRWDNCSEYTVNHTWKHRGKGDKGANGKQAWQGKCKRCGKPGHMAKIAAANAEIVCTRRFVVVGNRTKKAKEQAIANIEENLEDNELAYGR